MRNNIIFKFIAVLLCAAALLGAVGSAEMGAFGVELCAGISVPVDSGSIFADGAVELRSDYSNFNATVGYKIQF